MLMVAVVWMFYLGAIFPLYQLEVVGNLSNLEDAVEEVGSSRHATYWVYPGRIGTCFCL